MTRFKIMLKYGGQIFFQTNYPYMSKIPPQNIFFGINKQKNIIINAKKSSFTPQGQGNRGVTTQKQHF